MEAALLLSIGIPTLGGVVWLIRLEGRVNSHDNRHQQHEKNHGELREDITYIRARIDSALNGRHHQ